MLYAPVQSAAAEQQSTDTFTAFRLSDAIRFRTDFGLRSDADFVASTFSSASYESTEWGVPLDNDELSDLASRTVAREELVAAIDFANKQADNAGVYVDQRRGGRVVFLSTSPDSLTSTLAPFVPRDANIEIRGASRTLSDLRRIENAVVDKIPAFEKQGIAIRTTAVDVINNVVTIGTASADPALRARRPR